MYKRIIVILLLLFTATLFIGCKGKQGAETVVSEQKEALKEVVLEVETEKVVEPEDTPVESVTADVALEERMNPDDINVEYLFNQWQLISWKINNDEKFDGHDRNYLKIINNNKFIWHSINPFGDYDLVENGFFKISSNNLIFNYEDGAIGEFTILELTSDKLIIKTKTYDGADLTESIISTFTLLKEFYNFYGDYQAID